MKQRRRIYYSETQKGMMWDRWERGESLHDIARLFDRGHSTIQGILTRTGGIRPPPRVSALRAGAIFIGTRRDFTRYCCRPLDAFDRRLAKSRTFDSEL
jgi:hypothetical protein